MGVVLSAVLSSQVTLSYCIMSTIVILATNTTACTIFVPKVSPHNGQAGAGRLTNDIWNPLIHLVPTEGWKIWAKAYIWQELPSVYKAFHWGRQACLWAGILGCLLVLVSWPTISSATNSKPVHCPIMQHSAWVPCHLQILLASHETIQDHLSTGVLDIQKDIPWAKLHANVTSWLCYLHWIPSLKQTIKQHFVGKNENTSLLTGIPHIKHTWLSHELTKKPEWQTLPPIIKHHLIAVTLFIG